VAASSSFSSSSFSSSAVGSGRSSTPATGPESITIAAIITANKTIAHFASITRLILFTLLFDLGSLFRP
jgi:hypothetical protein